MTRQQLVAKNDSLFQKYLSGTRNSFTQTRNAQLLASVVPAVITAAKIATGTAAAVALAPTAVVGAAAVAVGGYAAYKLQLDKTIIGATIRMSDKVKGLFSGPAQAIQQKIEKIEPAKVSEPKNEAFERMDKIIEAHNRGDKFDTQTGQPLGSNPMETMKTQGISDDQIKQWQQRNQPTENKPTIESMAAMGRESGKSLSDAMFLKPSSQTLKQ